MDFETFLRLCDWIQQETGLTEDQAARYAREIGDTPDTDAAGNWVATVDARTISIKPMSELPKPS